MIDKGRDSLPRALGEERFVPVSCGLRCFWLSMVSSSLPAQTLSSVTLVHTPFVIFFHLWTRVFPETSTNLLSPLLSLLW